MPGALCASWRRVPGSPPGPRGAVLLVRPRTRSAGARRTAWPCPFGAASLYRVECGGRSALRPFRNALGSTRRRRSGASTASPSDVVPPSVIPVAGPSPLYRKTCSRRRPVPPGCRTATDSRSPLWGVIGASALRDGGVAGGTVFAAFRPCADRRQPALRRAVWRPPRARHCAPASGFSALLRDFRAPLYGRPVRSGSTRVGTCLSRCRCAHPKRRSVRSRARPRAASIPSSSPLFGRASVTLGRFAFVVGRDRRAASAVALSACDVYTPAAFGTGRCSMPFRPSCSTRRCCVRVRVWAGVRRAGFGGR